jgi:hypothetical protein
MGLTLRLTLLWFAADIAYDIASGIAASADIAADIATSADIAAYICYDGDEESCDRHRPPARPRCWPRRARSRREERSCGNGRRLEDAASRAEVPSLEALRAFAQAVAASSHSHVTAQQQAQQSEPEAQAQAEQSEPQADQYQPEAEAEQSDLDWGRLLRTQRVVRKSRHWRLVVNLPRKLPLLRART